MRNARFWTSTVILPEADIAIGPLPLPGLGVAVHGARELEIIGHGFSYRLRAPGFSDLDHAQSWLSRDLSRLGFVNVTWMSPEGSRFFLAGRPGSARSTQVGWVARADGDGPITVIETSDATIESTEDVQERAKTLVGVSEMWLHSFEHPDDALAHAQLSSLDLDLTFSLPAGTVPTGYAYGMIQTTRIGRHGGSRLVADGLVARTGDETKALAGALADDPGLHDARVRMVDSDVAEVRGTLRDDMGQRSELRCRIVPADEGAGLIVCSLTLEHEEDDEAKRLLATVTETVEAVGADPRPVPEDIPESASEALQIVDSFRRRLDADGGRVGARG
jgi:hypothetical protein